MSSSFLSSKDVFEWLSGFINLERGQKPKSFRIDRMEALTELAGHPEKCAPSIHIAGSKGKGSVTSMLSAMLTAAGFRAARYMSPHVTDIRERICLNDAFFDEDVYCAAGDELRVIAEEKLPAIIKSQSQTAALFDTSAQNGCEPTFWELLTLLFFLCARKAKCDVMVVETGMGGRLDSTNVLDPIVSVITLIELEHTNFLGNTIAEIAGEKAGIIKPNKPLILAKQCDEALEVFKKKAQEKNSPLFYYPEIIQLTNINITTLGTIFNINFNEINNENKILRASVSPCEPLFLPIPGKVQAENAALAIAAFLIFSEKISHKGTEALRNGNAVRKGLENLKIPARFEKICEEPPFIIDGAHTPESLAFCVETFCSLYGEGGILIFGCAADKDAAAMAKIVHQRFSKIIITTPGTFKVSDPVKVYETFVEIAGEEKVSLVKDTQEAVKEAISYAKNYTRKSSHRDTEAQRSQREELPILGAGSFYLVAEIRKIVSRQATKITI